MCFVSTTNSSCSNCGNCCWNVLQLCRDCCGNIRVRSGYNGYYNGCGNVYTTASQCGGYASANYAQTCNVDNGYYNGFGRCARSNSGCPCGCSD